MKYEEFAELIGFKKVNKIYIREENGFTLYLKDWQYMVLGIQSFYIPLDKEMTKDDLKAIHQAALGNVGTLFSLGGKNNTLIMSLPEGNKTKENKINETNDMIRYICDDLKKLGYGPMVKCPVCGNEAEYGEFGDNYCPIHDECITKYVEDIKTKASPTPIVKCVLSLLSSLVLGGIGVIPALLLCLYKNNYFAGILALMPILALLGYFLFKCQGRKWVNIGTGIIVFCLVIGFTAFAVPHMANGNSQTLVEYMFTGKWLGFRKCIFALILSMAGFGGSKYLDKFKTDYSKELKKFEE